MCDVCRSSKPASYVELHHNVGMLITRQTHETVGELCGACLGRAMWKHQLSNLFLGWWGAISFFMTGYYLFDNFRVYFRARRDMASAERRRTPEPDAIPRDPQVQLARFSHNVRLRLGSGEAPDDIIEDLSRIHRVPLDAAQRFVEGIAALGSHRANHA